MENEKLIERLIDLAFEEDIATGDITTESIIPATTRAKATMTAKAEGVISGLEIVERVFRKFEKDIVFTPAVENGDRVSKGDLILTVEGSYPALLKAERTALNFFQRMSGIATKTAEFVRELEGTGTQLLDTRKTAPGMRVTDKMAVKDGGGKNHRMGLYDMAMIKDNHIKMAGSISKAVEQVRSRIPSNIQIEVETTTLDEVREALACKADIIMLDNMDTQTMREAVKIIAGKAKTEASGNMSIPRMKEVAQCGVDYISVGALTHTVKALDISMNITTDDEDDTSYMVEEINRLRKERNAIILAHYYVAPEIQDIADFVGDSLELAKKAASTEADVIVFCGVRFMGETAAVITKGKRVLLPVENAGCSLANAVKGSQLKKWKEENPDGVVISYVNTTADTKAYTDICCTSANAVRVAKAVSEGKVPGLPKTDKILFVPDMHLGGYLNIVGNLNMQQWKGNCCVHEAIDSEMVNKALADYPEAEILIHPESKCSEDPAILGNPRCFFYSTSGIIKHVAESPKKQFVIATECGVLHFIRKKSPDKEVIPISEKALCKQMKRVTLDRLYDALRYDRYEVTVPKEIKEKAVTSVERMMQI